MPVTRGFARFLGRPLTGAERIVISRLERAKLNNSPIIVIDPPGTDSSHILRAYLDYRLSLAIPGTIAVIYDGCTRSTTRRLPDRKEIWNLSNRRPRRIVGCNPQFVLMLNVQTFGRHNPFRQNSGNFFDICATIFPTLGSGFIIIHFQATEQHRAFPLHLPEISSLTPSRILLREAKLHITIPLITGSPPNHSPASLTPSRDGPPSALVRISRSAELRPTITGLLASCQTARQESLDIFPYTFHCSTPNSLCINWINNYSSLTKHLCVNYKSCKDPAGGEVSELAMFGSQNYKLVVIE